MSKRSFPSVFVRLDIACQCFAEVIGAQISIRCRILGDPELNFRGKTRFDGVQYHCAVICETAGPLDFRQMSISVVGPNRVYLEATMILADIFSSNQALCLSSGTVWVRPTCYDANKRLHIPLTKQSQIAVPAHVSVPEFKNNAELVKLGRLVQDYQNMVHNEDSRRLALRIKLKNMDAFLGGHPRLTLRINTLCLQLEWREDQFDLATFPLSGHSQHSEVCLLVATSKMDAPARVTLALQTLLDVCGDSAELLLPLTHPSLGPDLTAAGSCLQICPSMTEIPLAQSTFDQLLGNFEQANLTLARRLTPARKKQEKPEAGEAGEVTALKAQLEAARSDLAATREALLQFQSLSQKRLQELQDRFSKEIGDSKDRVNSYQQQLLTLQ